MMRAAAVVLGGLLIVVGCGWALQGLGSQLVPTSFMTGSRIWIPIGLATAIGGVGVMAWSLTRK
jgi:hypothetical protein